MGIHKGTKLTEKLEYVAEKINISKSEVVRRGINIQYNELKKE